MTKRRANEPAIFEIFKMGASAPVKNEARIMRLIMLFFIQKTTLHDVFDCKDLGNYLKN